MCCSNIEWPVVLLLNDEYNFPDEVLRFIVDLSLENLNQPCFFHLFGSSVFA